MVFQTFAEADIAPKFFLLLMQPFLLFFSFAVCKQKSTILKGLSVSSIPLMLEEGLVYIRQLLFTFFINFFKSIICAVVANCSLSNVEQKQIIILVLTIIKKF